MHKSILPIQFLGPSPNGKYAQGCLCFTRSGENLVGKSQQNKFNFDVTTVPIGRSYCGKGSLYLKV